MTPLSVSEGMPDSSLEITSDFGGKGFDLNVLRILRGVLNFKRFHSRKLRTIALRLARR